METRRGLGSEAGFALAYVLMVVTILGLVAYSVIMLQHVRRMIAVKEIARSKARNAGQSIIAEYASHRREDPDMTQEFTTLTPHMYSDGAEASLRVYPWGLYELAVARGWAGRAVEVQTAVLASVPDSLFKRALCFGNLEHDLILTGRTKITGDVSLRRGSASVGTLPDVKPPRFLPVTGSIKREPAAPYPLPVKAILRESVLALEDLLQGSEEATSGFLKITGSMSPGDSWPDTAVWQGVSGSLALNKELRAKNHPIYIAVDGEILIERGARLSGPIALLAAGRIMVSEGASLHDALMYSRKGIEYHNHSECSCQLLAPRILIGEGALLEYPSAVAALPGRAPLGREPQVKLASGSHVEGFVGIFSSVGGSGEDPPLLLEPGASVSGAVYSDRSMTLDGDVIGSVFTRDFQFTQPPTKYTGWIRSGTIDRSRLPEGFLVPVLLGALKGKGVLQWL
jgi:hypothetical protein